MPPTDFLKQRGCKYNTRSGFASETEILSHYEADVSHPVVITKQSGTSPYHTPFGFYALRACNIFFRYTYAKTNRFNRLSVFLAAEAAHRHLETSTSFQSKTWKWGATIKRGFI
jgi:hypothetical protein